MPKSKIIQIFLKIKESFFLLYLVSAVFFIGIWFLIDWGTDKILINKYVNNDKVNCNDVVINDVLKKCKELAKSNNVLCRVKSSLLLSFLLCDNEYKKNCMQSSVSSMCLEK